MLQSLGLDVAKSRSDQPPILRRVSHLQRQTTGAKKSMMLSWCSHDVLFESGGAPEGAAARLQLHLSGQPVLLQMMLDARKDMNDVFQESMKSGKDDS